MIYEVRVFTPKGDLKKIVSSTELSIAHWESFNRIHLPSLDSMKLLREYKKQSQAAAYHTDNSDAQA